jgi:hypothetical protein
MLRLERTGGAVTVVSRLARPRVLAVLAIAIGGGALGAWAASPRAAAALGLAAALVVLLGGRAVRASFARGRVRIRPAAPFQRGGERALGAFVRAAVETVGEDRARRAERIAARYRARSGAEMPAWLRATPTPGVNDHLRRVVLVARDGDRVAVTAWLAPDDDLEPLRAELEALLRGGDAG